MKLRFDQQRRRLGREVHNKTHTGAPSSSYNTIGFQNTKFRIWMCMQVVARCLYPVQTYITLLFLYITYETLWL